MRSGFVAVVVVTACVLMGCGGVDTPALEGESAPPPSLDEGVRSTLRPGDRIRVLADGTVMAPEDSVMAFATTPACSTQCSGWQSIGYCGVGVVYSRTCKVMCQKRPEGFWYQAGDAWTEHECRS